MSSHIVIVENPADWKAIFPNIQIVTAKEYLTSSTYFARRGTKIINLCRNYRYLSRGYYCSLLAEARYHKVIPTVKTLRDLSSKSTYSLDIDDLGELLQKSLAKTDSPNVKTAKILKETLIFGRCHNVELKKLAQQIFTIFSCPLMQVEFRYQGKWQISSIKPFYLNNLKDDQNELFIESLNSYILKRWIRTKAKPAFRYDLAILHNPSERLAPSKPATLEKFVRIGKKLGIYVDLIEKKDYPYLAEYDALFIRETTRIGHHTYRFSKKAESEGLVVIDDPNSILRCTNKVYLAELLNAKKIPIPKTLILQRESVNRLENELPYPVVLKIPDSSFSLGVFKVEDYKQALEMTKKLFKESDIILAQEYLYTPFDWRIGILNRKPIYACQYFMSEEHWQILKHDMSSGKYVEGEFRTFPVEEVPEKVIAIALKATQQIGDGLYGVDLKHTRQGIFVIEVNDNPNIDEGVENAVLQDELYQIIIQDFIRRLEKRSEQQ